jgi:hypothetical protein
MPAGTTKSVEESATDAAVHCALPSEAVVRLVHKGVVGLEEKQP